MATDKQKLNTLLDAAKQKLVTAPIVTSVDEFIEDTKGEKVPPNQKPKVPPK